MVAFLECGKKARIIDLAKLIIKLVGSSPKDNHHLDEASGQKK